MKNKIKVFKTFFLVVVAGSPIFAGTMKSSEVFEPEAPTVSFMQRKDEVRQIEPFARLLRDSSPPEKETARKPSVVAWRGEIVNFRFGVWVGGTKVKKNVYTEKFFLNKTGIENKGEKIEACVSPIRYAIGRDGAQFADIVDPEGTPTFTPAGTLREFLVSVSVPIDAKPGDYRGIIVLDGKTHDVALQVLRATLPSPQKRSIHLDLWQHPQAVARWENVKPWSKEHFDALVPVMTRLRDLGQKAITCSIIEEPWNHQTFDDWESMVKWTKERNGEWTFDYTIFDKWVAFMINKIGIQEQISCYSMLPWKMKIRYFDKTEKEQKEIKLDINSPEFSKTWGAFLSDFKKHLIQKGWLEKTCIALDERPDEQLNAARKVIEEFAPELKIVSANDHPSQMSEFVYDVSPIFTHSGGDVPALAKKRRTENKKTTFYVCVNPARPNTFTHSAPAEAHWLGFYAATHGFDGFLRWAYNSWNKNPFETTAFGNWPAGDCFLVYPGNRSSMRLEHLRDGLEDFEKIKILRASIKSEKKSDEKLKAAVAELDDYLHKTFTVSAGGGNDHEEQVLRAIELLNAAAVKLN